LAPVFGGEAQGISFRESVDLETFPISNLMKTEQSPNKSQGKKLENSLSYFLKMKTKIKLLLEF